MDALNIVAVATLKSLNVLIEKMESVLSGAGDEVIDGCSSEALFRSPFAPSSAHGFIRLWLAVSVSFAAAASPQMVPGPDGTCYVLPVECVLASVSEINASPHSRECAQTAFYRYVICHEPQEQTAPPSVWLP